jgi:hypothetical protein
MLARAEVASLRRATSTRPLDVFSGEDGAERDAQIKSGRRAYMLPPIKAWAGKEAGLGTALRTGR